MKRLQILLLVLGAIFVASPTAMAQGIETIDPFRRDIQPLTIQFEPGGFALTTAAMDQLNRLAERLRDTRDRIEIKAYAGDAQISTQDAVKLSFKRGVIIRTLLIEAGVLTTQIVVKAQGKADDGGLTERVDIKPLER